MAAAGLRLKQQPVAFRAYVELRFDMVSMLSSQETVIAGGGGSVRREEKKRDDRKPKWA